MTRCNELEWAILPVLRANMERIETDSEPGLVCSVAAAGRFFEVWYEKRTPRAVRLRITSRSYDAQQPRYKNGVLETAFLFAFLPSARVARWCGPSIIYKSDIHTTKYRHQVVPRQICFFCESSGVGCGERCGGSLKRHAATIKHKKNEQAFIQECAAGWSLNADCTKQILSYLRI
jgi:hypothetical protein